MVLNTVRSWLQGKSVVALPGRPWSRWFVRPRLEALEDRTLPSVSTLFTSPIVTATGSTNLHGLVAGDFNGDGKLDVITTNDSLDGSAPATLGVFLGNGQGGFTPAPGSPINTGTTNALEDAVVGDFTNNGKLDLAVLNGNFVQIWLGDGKGGFTLHSSFLAGPTNAPSAIVAGDVNNDGKTDLVTAENGGSGSVNPFLGDGTGSFTSTPPKVVMPEFALAVGDFNGDGNLDLAVSVIDGTVQVFLGDGKGDFTQAPGSPYQTGLSVLGPHALQVGDFNKDGKLDLVLAGSVSGAGAVKVLTGNGQGGFTVGPAIGLNNWPTAVAVADFNGDGNPDLFVLQDIPDSGVPTSPQVLLGNGQGGFVDGGVVPGVAAGAVNETDVVVGDFNGDGKPDVAIADDSTGNVDVLLNQAGQMATTTTLTSNPAPSLYGQSVTFTATVSPQSGTPTGNVTFTLDGGTPQSVALTNGQAAFTPPTLSPGSHTVAVNYAAQGNFAASSATLTQAVLIPTTLDLNSSFNPSVVGQPVTFTATVLPQAAGTGPTTGTVTFRNSLVPIGTVNVDPNSGQATFTPPTPLAAGNLFITAVYSGDSSYQGSTSPLLTQVVRPAGRFTWSGAGPDDRWTDTANWLGNAAPAPGDQLVFPEESGQHTNVNDFPAGSFFAGISFVGTAATDQSGYSIGGNPITLGVNGISDRASVQAMDTFAPGITETGFTLVIAVANGALRLGRINGTAAILKTGPGSVELEGDDSYTGTTQVQQGAVIVNNPNALGSGAAGVIVGAAGELTLDADAGLVARSIVFQTPAVTRTQLLSLQGTNGLTGSIQINGAGKLQVSVASGSLTLSGPVVSGVGALSVVNSSGPGGKLVLSGNNPNLRGIVVGAGGVVDVQNSAALGDPAGSSVVVQSGGALEIEGGLTFRNTLFLQGGTLRSLDAGDTWAGSIFPVTSTTSAIQVDTDSLTISGPIFGIVGLGAGRLRKTGEGELLLTGNNSSYKGAIEIDAGVLRAASAAALGSASAGLTVLGGTLELAGTFTLSKPLTLAGAGVDNTGALRLADSGSQVTLQGNITLADSSFLGTDANTKLFVNGTVAGGEGAALDKVGSGALFLNAANKYLGPTAVVDGQLDITNNTALGLGSAGAAVFQGGGIGLYGGSSGLFISTPLTLDGRGGPTVSLANVTGGNLWHGPVTLLSTSDIRVFAASLVIKAVIDGMPGAGLYKDGPGLLGLTADNTYSGTTTLADGVLDIFGHQPFSPIVVQGGTFKAVTSTVGTIDATGGIVSLLPSAKSSMNATDVTLGAGSTLQYTDPLPTFAAPLPLIVSGNLTLGGNLAIPFTTANAPPVGTHITLIKKTSPGRASGTFAGLAEGSIFSVGSLGFQIMYQGGAGADVVVTRIA